MKNAQISKLSDKELIDVHNQHLYQIDKSILTKKYTIDEIGDIIPGVVMLHNVSLETQSLAYMNSEGRDNLGYTMQELREMGQDYYINFFPSGQSDILLEGLNSLFVNDSYQSSYSFYQQVKVGTDGEYEWYYTNCKLLKNTECNSGGNLLMISNAVKGMGYLVGKVNKVLEQNTYILKNYKKFAALTKRELEIIKLLVDGKSSTEIAEELFISKHTVNTHRKNIVYKLEVKSFAELLQFALAFDLTN